MVCRLALMDALADAVERMEASAYGLNENEFNPSEVVVCGDDFRAVDICLARLVGFETMERKT
jgi:hypothetical protein